MRQLLLSLALALAPAAALAASLSVPLDQSALITLPTPARNVIVGNPTIADVSVSDQRHIIITGKGQGITNLVITDAAGRTIFDRQIVVGGSSADRVALINGATITRYACAPTCEQMEGAQGGGASAGGAGAGAVTAPAPAMSAAPGPHP
jgi:Pilus formation protein N terminal region